jgi:hypothetical protein
MFRWTCQSGAAKCSAALSTSTTGQRSRHHEFPAHTRCDHFEAVQASASMDAWFRCQVMRPSRISSV